MLLFDLVGALLTVVAFLFLGLAGYLLAVALLGERSRTDPLATAVAALLAATATGVLSGLVLGALGLLRVELGLALVAALVVGLLRSARRRGDPWEPGRLALRRTRDRVREHPAMALIALHAIGSEALRGLLRPPLSWDSLMYHLLLAATWLQDRNLAPVFGPPPTSFYGFQPGNGSLWLWWWMAPSHGELYVNLAFLPQWLLLGLAAGAVARELGARRHWPLASYLVLLTPTVVRFAATQYVDILVAAALVAACFFSLRWLAEPRRGEAFLAGAGLGLTAGTKVLALPYALAWSGVVVLAALPRGGWRRRAPQLAAALALFAVLGGYFYARNAAAGAGPLGLRCEGTKSAAEGTALPSLPRPNTLLALLGPMISSGQLAGALLGDTRPQSLELGIGPQVLLLVPALFLPLAFPPGRRRGTVLVWSQIAVQVAIWVSVPYVDSGVIYANPRYAIGALALAFAGLTAAAELRGVPESWLSGLAFALLVQDLLQLHAEMPRSVRVALALADAAALALALSPRLRARVRARARPLAAGGLLLALAGAPLLGRFRAADRGRAMAQEFTTHATPIAIFARAWDWLETNGGDGTVAVASAPAHYFVYPAMGLHLDRRAIFVNVDEADRRNAAAYPGCDPRVDPSPEAWIRNLRRQRVRWVHLSRYPHVDFLPEAAWAEARPGLFALRYADPANRIYELLPGQ